MDGIFKFIIVIVILFVIFFGFGTIHNICTINNIKEDVAKLEDVTCFYQERYTGLTEIDDETDEIEGATKQIYKEYNDTIIIEEGNTINVLYGGQAYVLNKEQKFFYKIEEHNLPNYDLTSDIFPKLKTDTDTWDLANSLDIKTETFKDESCYAITIEDGDKTYTNYIRKDDGVCIGKCEKVNGETTYEYYKTEIEDVNINDFTYDAIFNGYDEVIQSAFDHPYVERSDGTREYINLQ